MSDYMDVDFSDIWGQLQRNTTTNHQLQDAVKHHSFNWLHFTIKTFISRATGKVAEVVSEKVTHNERTSKMIGGIVETAVDFLCHFFF